MSRCLALALLFLSTPALAMDDDPWDDPPPDGSTHSVCTDNINAKVAQLASQGINLGAKSGQLNVVSASFCWQAFKSGRIHTGTTSTSATVAITGTVLSKFASLGYEAGFGQALAPVTDPGGIQRWRFRNGYIVVRPSYWTRAIRNPLSSQWVTAGGVARFGYPTGDQVTTPSGVSYSRLDNGLVLRTNELGEWIEQTAGAGRIAAILKVFQHSLTGTKNERTLSSENPLVTGPQLVTLGLNDQISSFTVNTSGRSSLYLYEHFPIDGRYMRVSGGDMTRVQVSNIGTFMNDRVSSIMLVNHGLASRSITKQQLNADLMVELDDLDELIEADFESNNWYELGDAVFDWSSTSFTVQWLPGQRAFEVTRSGIMWVGDFWAVAHVPVMFKAKLRPYVTETAIAGDPSYRRLTVHARVLDGSILPNGECGGSFDIDHCDELETALSEAFSSTISTRMTEAFATVLDAETEDLETVQAACMNGAGVRRVNVLPDAGLEVVVADSTDQNTCVKGLEDGGYISRLDHAANRPVGQITQGYANGALGAPAFDGARTVVLDYSIPEPPTDVYP